MSWHSNQGCFEKAVLVDNRRRELFQIIWVSHDLLNVPTATVLQVQFLYFVQGLVTGKPIVIS